MDDFKNHLDMNSKDPSTIDAYIRVMRQFMEWLLQRPGSGGRFQTDLLTKNALQTFINELEDQGYSVSHRNRVKTVVGQFANWMLEEKGIHVKNPSKNIVIPPQEQLAPRELSLDQRYILKNLIERAGDERSAAMFALGYWAACRSSDVTNFLVRNADIGPKIGVITVGHKAGKMRKLDILNEVRGPLYNYLKSETRKFPDSPFVFTSKRSERLTENGLHRWFNKIKTDSRKDEWILIEDITFHDLRHDFAHRARKAGWKLEEIALYLGHINNQGTAAIQSTVRYTQPTREQLKRRLLDIKG
ncbi:tyrosine-type recombinase/integrase [Paenibacillus agilis]|uniref:Tyrosine-type recombinase/integrase n=2 Tax=Paenibacillus agilis TaxID=3020863 RepID=A0A559IDA9_9BACL|nr:tyrosine-type recombinase/integrase [Paenibacillus agilis]